MRLMCRPRFGDARGRENFHGSRRSRQRGTGLNYPDLPIFVAIGETTCCVGDFLAMVVADTAFHARAGRRSSKSRLHGARARDRSVRRARTRMRRKCIPRATCGARQCAGHHRVLARRCGRGVRNCVRAHHRADLATQPIEPAFLEPEACLAHAAGRWH
jgi:hypothetical protein